ncbi:MAG: hypothetical protein QS748_10015 [Candidatus Endonucleobacter bathymodioli]|uniref:Ysc84 actin-binding domain-containing protein n=1 Tax=Candidatus Endonucleibacter bathymodioli TaxID=539814 RepID=A0AA90P000_9GAMM|nr:hypothetical protein [Candidatus Endonucleobacter bathymodioli]
MLNKTITVLLIFAFLSGCSATGTTPADKRASINQMHNKVLSEIYAKSSTAKSDVSSSAGYAVFSNAQINLFIVSGGTGFGVAKSNGKSIYMKMAEAGIGLGLGVKDFRALFVFHTQKAYTDFVEKGWAFGAEADAAAKTSDKGGETGGGVTIGNITVYQITDTGLTLQATVKGTKYWKDSELN